MEHQETKFTFVYNEIKQSILEGQIPPGGSLLSSRMYCEQFHVSRYTMNRVFDVLREEGLIEIKPRLAPVAAAVKDKWDLSETAVDILKQKDSILQLYRTFAMILPSLLVFSLQGCDVKIMPHYKQAMKDFRLGYSAGRWRSLSKLIYDILKIGGNSLFSELYSAFGLYNKFAFFTEDSACFSQLLLKGAVSGWGDIMDILKSGEPAVMYGQLFNIYQELSDFIECTLEGLSRKVPVGQVHKDMPFFWNPMRGQEYCYTRIAMDLNKKISLKEYSAGMYLPYAKQLAAQYDVSLATVRKALLELEQWGVVKTLNGKGTIVTEPDDEKIYERFLGSGFPEKALRYLHALQLMVLIIRPAALACAKHFAKEELEELEKALPSSETAYLTDVFEAILKHTTLQPFYVILAETNHLLEGGYYFVYFLSGEQIFSQINKKVLFAIRQLKDGDADLFADSIADCYRCILGCMKKNMAEKHPFSNGAKIRIPEKYA